MASLCQGALGCLLHPSYLGATSALPVARRCVPHVGCARDRFTICEWRGCMRGCGRRRRAWGRRKWRVGCVSNSGTGCEELQRHAVIARSTRRTEVDDGHLGSCRHCLHNVRQRRGPLEAPGGTTKVVHLWGNTVLRPRIPLDFISRRNWRKAGAAIDGYRKCCFLVRASDAVELDVKECLQIEELAQAFSPWFKTGEAPCVEGDESRRW